MGKMRAARGKKAKNAPFSDLFQKSPYRRKKSPKKHCKDRGFYAIIKRYSETKNPDAAALFPPFFHKETGVEKRGENAPADRALKR